MHRSQLRGALQALVLCALAAISAAAGAGCARAQASIEPEMPALAAPPPPPRVLPPLEWQPIEAATTAPTEPQGRPRVARPRPEAPRAANGTSKPDARPDGAPAGSAPSEAGAAAANGGDALAPQPPALQLAPAGDVVSEQNTRGRLAEAERNLQRVDYRLLNTDAKAQYDTAKRFIVLAEQAIVDRNLLFAQTLADKAATIAAVLQRR